MATTRFADSEEGNKLRVNLPRSRRIPIGLVLLVVAIVLLVVACAAPETSPGASGAPAHRDAEPGSDAASSRKPGGEPGRPARLAVHADLPAAVHPARRPRPGGQQHCDRDRPADDHHPDRPHPALPAADRVAEADAARPARAQGAPEALQGRSAEGHRGATALLRRARDQPGIGLPAHHPPVRAAHPDVLGHQRRSHEHRPERDAEPLRDPALPAAVRPDAGHSGRQPRQAVPRDGRGRNRHGPPRDPVRLHDPRYGLRAERSGHSSLRSSSSSSPG